MKIIFHKNFEKNYARLTSAQKEKFKNRKNIFLSNQFDPILRNHALSGRYEGYRSISITGDLRVIYMLINETTAFFVDIDSHSNLYR
ncbi:MAG: hypothetical protein A3J48_02475 [Candidatus Doudnabacteria bacterium RIFCSPHIGHO2_02_FULL_46_11]|uniref:Type II toxin-antitoxin system mRNA interferase toxin, RelE/StbE family n=1 Tax=Candidatus Doudnabacteria bacterium RIFCSPHIGHO2_02_FULL_46_11 TaxID=1817832 RepID=A0A1F5P9J5_9BACT|nr:MAG: hypothetical protein A3J48_02475 [Candidatus Doudnabacteria bacterium RIFCSPHIGHO2_02_FULL_46_11]